MTDDQFRAIQIKMLELRNEYLEVAFKTIHENIARQENEADVPVMTVYAVMCSSFIYDCLAKYRPNKIMDGEICAFILMMLDQFKSSLNNISNNDINKPLADALKHFIGYLETDESKRTH